MLTRLVRGRRPLVWLAVVLAACSADRITAPSLSPSDKAAYALSPTGYDVVISQVYGGGGNAGATYKNDFIELHNRSAQAVTVTGWSVQYASAAGTSWQVTPLTGTIQPGAYYLVQEAAGTGGTTALPSPNASGGIPMSATAGKVALVTSTVAGSGACPTTVIDLVSFGAAATDCGMKTTATLTNTTAALRLGGACKYTGDLSVDFATGAPAPRNASSATNSCDLTPVGPMDRVVIAGAATVTAGSTTQLTATAQDASGKPVNGAVYQWSSSDESIATVDASGKVTGVVVSETPATITVKATKDGIEKTASHTLTVATPSIAWIDVTTFWATSMPPGFQSQFFITARTGSGGLVIPANFTIESLNPEIATMAMISGSAIITAVAPPADGTTRPSFKITATPIAGGPSYSFTSRPIAVEVPVNAPLGIYSRNDEFGTPTPASTGSPDDMLIVRPQYTLSYNQSRGTPNWVAHELDARQFGNEDRCDCFTADPLVPAARQIFASDYTDYTDGNYDRGHMVRSADRTAANVDNATTFYMTNIIPQHGDLNQGVWSQFEIALGDSAKAGRAVYIVTGPLYGRNNTLRYLNNAGKVAIPDSTWKVAFIGPRTGGTPFNRSTIQTWGDLAGTTVLAVNMPNVAGVRNNPWAMYLTTVDKIEAATGYDMLSVLPVAFQTALEAGDRAPTASFTRSGALAEGTALTFDASASTDPDLGSTTLSRTEALSFSWTFGDGTTATGVTTAKTYANDGTYTVTLTVTDVYGWEKTASQTLVVANVAPQVAAFSGATILSGETYAASGSFADPGSDPWTATVNYGDGSGDRSLALAGKSFTLSHQYAAAGSFTVTVTIHDGAATTTRSATVAVDSPVSGVSTLSSMVGALGTDGTLEKGEVNSLQAKLDAAAKKLVKNEDKLEGKELLNSFVNELQALVNSSRLSEAAAAPLIAYAQRVSGSAGL